jgi:hypothetical protein
MALLVNPNKNNKHIFLRDAGKRFPNSLIRITITILAKNTLLKTMVKGRTLSSRISAKRNERLQTKQSNNNSPQIKIDIIEPFLLG